MPKFRQRGARLTRVSACLCQHTRTDTDCAPRTGHGQHVLDAARFSRQGTWLTFRDGRRGTDVRMARDGDGTRVGRGVLGGGGGG